MDFKQILTALVERADGAIAAFFCGTDGIGVESPVDGETVDDDDLHVPHPRMFERPFVLAPLEHLAPDLVGPAWRERFDHLGVWLLGDLDAIP